MRTGTQMNRTVIAQTGRNSAVTSETNPLALCTWFGQTLSTLVPRPQLLALGAQGGVLDARRLQGSLVDPLRNGRRLQPRGFHILCWRRVYHLDQPL